MSPIEEIKQLINNNVADTSHRNSLLKCVDKLVDDQRFLHCFAAESAGMDNWDDEYAQEMFQSDE